MLAKVVGLRARLMVLILLAVLPAMVVLLNSVNDRRSSSQERAQAQALQIARTALADYDHSLESTRSFLAPLAQVFAVVPDLSVVSRDPCQSFFETLLASDSRFLLVGVATAEGGVVCASASGDPGLTDVSAQPFFHDVLQRRSFASDLVTDHAVAQPVVYAGSPVLAADGRAKGVVYAALDLNALSTSLGETALPPGGRVLLLSPTGTVLARYPEPEVWVGKVVEPPSALPSLAAGKEGVTFEGKGLDGVPVLSASVGMRQPDSGSIEGVLTVSLPKSQVYAGIDERLRIDLFALLAVALLATGAAWFGSGAVLKRIWSYVNTTERIAAGDLEARTGPRYQRSELGRLGRAIDAMAAAVAEREREVRTLNEELEHRVLERTAQLEAANSELEAFSYSVSHDLRAPLRGIDGFSQALAEDYGESLDSDGRAMLGRIRNATQRMGQLIDDLLQLSRVTRATFTREDVDLSALAASIMDELRKTEPARDVTFLAPPDIMATGDRRLLRIALVNLLQNAWKFTGRAACARIEFGVDCRAAEPVYFVRDNGAGFDMAYADKLFGAFQRLHAMDEFPGTGIGLATVKRIVLRHGGRVWAEGGVEKGATFYFTIGSVPIGY